MTIRKLRKLVTRYKHYAVIESEMLFGHFFGYTGMMPNSSFTVLLARNRRNAVRRYAERYRRRHHHYPDYYMKGMMLIKCPLRFGRYCVIDENKDQTFFRM